MVFFRLYNFPRIFQQEKNENLSTCKKGGRRQYQG